MGKEVAAQFTPITAWPDGSVRQLDVDFAPSPGPRETLRYQLLLGQAPRNPARKGLEVTETADEIVVASSAIAHRIRRDGKPLLTSVAFGEHEFIAADGVRTTLPPGPVEIVKRGPFNVTLKMGAVRLEYVNTKSWVKITQQADSPRDLAVDAHFRLAKSPLLWDLGLGSWLYGNLAKPSQSVTLRHRDGNWQVLTAPDSVFATSPTFDGCGHLADSQLVAAFGIDQSSTGAPLAVDLGGDGRVRIAARRDNLVVYFHWVAQPIPVTAVTSPQAMVAPLVVGR